MMGLGAGEGSLGRREVAENEELEIGALLEAIYQKYGYDFRGYSRASVKRRVRRRLARSGLGSISEMLHEVLYDGAFFESLLLELSINVTEMFRDPPFFRALREKVVPVLAGQRFIRVWHAGCATGEEVYSMAIVLREMGLYDRAQIYATDMNEVALNRAREGIYPLAQIQEYTANYQKAGGTESFGDYYTARYDSAIMEQSLREHLVFSDHNLVTDGVFGEMDLVICRNVLIYFGRALQNQVVELFRDSLREGGFLLIGSKESLRFMECGADFDVFLKKERVYRRKFRIEPGEAGPGVLSDGV